MDRDRISVFPEYRVDGGLSLRDHFAGLAMIGLMQVYRDRFLTVAVLSYEMADLMLKAREKV